MILVQCKQGDPDWHAARVAVTTASRAKDACDKLKSGQPSQKAVAYAAEIAMESVAGVTCSDVFVNFAMRRGSELEPHARIAYEAATGNLVDESGIYLTDDRVFGYSSDGAVNDDGLIEIKCPLSALTVISMWRSGDLSEYVHQIQMGMWLTGRKWLDFVMFDPRLAPVGKSLFVKRVQRDEAFIEAMESDLMKFVGLVREFEGVLRANAGEASPVASIPVPVKTRATAPAALPTDIFA